MNVCAAWTKYEADVKGHVPIVTLYADMFKGQISSYSEWTLDWLILGANIFNLYFKNEKIGCALSQIQILRIIGNYIKSW